MERVENVGGTGLILGGVRKDGPPVVIGIDFGTAYSGIAVGFLSCPESVFCGAPTARNTSEHKVPTVLLQLEEDGSWFFGYEALERYNQILSKVVNSDDHVPAHIYRRFKMDLNQLADGGGPLMSTAANGHQHRLMDLIVRTLRFLADFALEVAAGHYGVMPEASHVQWVITVPAIWNDFGKAFMRKAARKAGLIDETSSPYLTLALEPECAALAMYVSAGQTHLFRPQNRFMVVDCGGGTVDITVHEVITEFPLAIKTITPPTGGPWGGELVMDQFTAFLRELLGPKLYPENTPANATTFYEIGAEFRKVMMTFDPSDGNQVLKIQLEPVLDRRNQLMELAPVWNESHPERPVLAGSPARNGFLMLSPALMLSFFEASLQPVVAETRRVLENVADIRHMVVVGGFGSGKVVRERMRAEFAEEVSLLLPDSKPNPQGAIVHGAVYAGLYRDIVTSRISPYTYGIDMARGDVDNAFHILVRRGQEVKAGHEVRVPGLPQSADATALVWQVYRSTEENPLTVADVGTLRLGRVTAQCPPHWDQRQRRQTGVFVFGGSEIRVVIERLVDGMVVTTHGEIMML